MSCEFTISTLRCWSFIVTTTISFTVLTISIAGLAGAFPSFNGDMSVFSGLLTLIIGLWFPRPTIQSHIGDLKLAQGANPSAVYIDGTDV